MRRAFHALAALPCLIWRGRPVHVVRPLEQIDRWVRTAEKYRAAEQRAATLRALARSSSRSLAERVVTALGAGW